MMTETDSPAEKKNRALVSADDSRNKAQAIIRHAIECFKHEMLRIEQFYTIKSIYATEFNITIPMFSGETECKA